MLFADLVGYTAFAEGRDPEQTKHLVDRCFERLAGDIVNHGGRVDKVLGDAIIAVFGAPVAHEDDAERAVRAALQLRRSTAAYAAETGLPLELRIGVNTGEVLIGAMRAGGDTTAMGDAVNVASRLQTAAEPGQVLVGAATHAQTSAAVRYEPMGTLAVRNREQPVEAHAAIEAVAPPGHRARRSRTPFVGRQHELAMLRAAFHLGLVRCRPQLIVITGDAGVGKSRLAEEVATTAAPPGARVLDSRCTPYGETNVWWPLAEALRQSMAAGVEAGDVEDCEITPQSLHDIVGRLFTEAGEHSHGLTPGLLPDPKGALDRIVDGLRYVLGDGDALAHLDAAQARDEALRSAVAVLDGVTRHKPVVLGISELHWADDVILEFIDRAMDRLAGRPLVILTSARPELLTRWTPRGGRHGVLGLHLEPFTDDEAADLLDRIFEGAARPELVEQLLSRSGGNPLFLEELAQLVREAGHDQELPATLRGLVATRLDALDRAHRRVIDDAAVVGRVGGVDELLELSGSDGAGLARILADLDGEDLLVVERQRWTFRSDIVREVAYETLTKAERARRHAHLAFHSASAAEVVQTLGPIEGVPADITDRAIDALGRAAERAIDREFSTEALRLYERGLALLPDGDSPARRRFLAGRGRANTLLQRGEQAWADLEASLAASRASADHDAEAKALTALGQLAQGEGRFAEAEHHLGAALEVWRLLGDVEGEARVLRLQATLYLMADRVADANAALDAARRHYEDLGDRRGLAWAQQQLGWIAFTRGDLATADALLAESATTFGAMGDYAGLAWAMGVHAWVRLQQGHLGEAERMAEQVLSRGETDSWAGGMLKVLLASTRLWTGRTEEAVELAEEAYERFVRMGDRLAQLRAMGLRLRAMVAAGRAHEAVSTIERYRKLMEEEAVAFTWAKMVGMQILTAAGLSAKALEIAGTGATVHAGLTLLMAGRDDDALERLAQEWAGAEGPGAIPDAGASYALALAVTGDAARCREVVAEAWAVDGGTYHDRMLLLVARALAALATGDGASARADLAAAVAAADSTGDRMAQAVARLVAGHALGDEPLLAEARSRVSAMGLPHTDWDDLFARARSFSASGAGERTEA